MWRVISRGAALLAVIWCVAYAIAHPPEAAAKLKATASALGDAGKNLGIFLKSLLPHKDEQAQGLAPSAPTRLPTETEQFLAEHALFLQTGELPAEPVMAAADLAAPTGTRSVALDLAHPSLSLV